MKIHLAIITGIANGVGIGAVLVLLFVFGYLINESTKKSSNLPETTVIQSSQIVNKSQQAQSGLVLSASSPLKFTVYVNVEGLKFAETTYKLQESIDRVKTTIKTFIGTSPITVSQFSVDQYRRSQPFSGSASLSFPISDTRFLENQSLEEMSKAIATVSGVSSLRITK